MGRTGVSYEAVKAAAEAVWASNQQDPNRKENSRPTNAQVHQYLGTGSASTICKHMRTWRASLTATDHLTDSMGVPEPLAITIKSLWQQLQNSAKEDVATIEQALGEEKRNLEQALAEANQLNQQQADQITALNDSHADLQNQLSEATAQLTEAEKNYQALTAKYDQQTADAKAKDERIDTLQQHIKQNQQNLEHYRREAKDQREKLNLTIRDLKQQHKAAVAAQQAAEKTCVKMTEEHQSLDKQYQSVRKVYLRLSIGFSKLERTEKAWKERALIYEERAEKNEKELENLHEVRYQTARELALLKQTYQEEKERMTLLETTNQQLEDEKLSLIKQQENLEGQLAVLKKGT